VSDQRGVWQAVLGEIELSISRGNFMTWFNNTTMLDDGKASGQVVIGVPNVFIKQQLERKYSDLMRDILTKNGLTADNVEYRIYTPRTRDVVINMPASEPATSDTPSRVEFNENPTSNQPAASGKGRSQGINDRYTFDNFVVGSGNELAFAACQSIAANPGDKYNPLFLYGGVGIGKTHLMQAVGNAILTKNPAARVLYITTEQFVQEFVQALRFKKTTDFVKHYRTTDVLIVDDMQFIAGKEKIQEEFFHTFNALHQANKQIIISSDRPPKEIPTLEERLRSRFAWGMSIDMQIPDFETRCAILQTKAQGHGATLPDDVVDYLATSIQTNIRELEGALNQLLAFCEMRGMAPDLQTVTGLFGSSKTRPKHLSAKQIIERTARHFHIPLEDMLGPKRDKDIVVPRQVAMYMLRSELHLSFPKIARELGRKDHTTAIHSVEKIERETQFDTELRTAIADIRGHLYV
jgi:chromosomal replication initiator protein